MTIHDLLQYTDAVFSLSDAAVRAIAACFLLIRRDHGILLWRSSGGASGAIASLTIASFCIVLRQESLPPRGEIS
jgi:hypothetical protein